MLRLLALAAGAYWLRKPENRELAERKIRQAWHRVANGGDKRRSDDSAPYHDDRQPHDDGRHW